MMARSLRDVERRPTRRASPIGHHRATCTGIHRHTQCKPLKPLKPGHKVFCAEAMSYCGYSPGSRRVSLNKTSRPSHHTPLPPQEKNRIIPPNRTSPLEISRVMKPHKGARHYCSFGGPLLGHHVLVAPGSESCRRGPSQNSKSRCVCPGLAKREDLLPGRLGRRLGPLAGRSGNEADQSAGQRARDDVVDEHLVGVVCVVCGVWVVDTTSCAPLLAILIY